MIPIKDKKYMINCQGPYDYNRYMGEGICTGEVDKYDPEKLAYGFKIPDYTRTVFFIKEEIVAMVVAEQMIAETPEEIQNQIDSENNYCKTCNSCGDTGCCAPINCDAVICKYGEINLKDYECFQNQWEIMLNALEDIAKHQKEEHIGHSAENALKAVDKEWDKLYSKE